MKVEKYVDRSNVDCRYVDRSNVECRQKNMLIEVMLIADRRTCW